MLERQSNALLKLEQILAQNMKKIGLWTLSQRCDRLLSLETKFKPQLRRLEKKHWIREWVLAFKSKRREDSMYRKARKFRENSTKVL